MPAGFRSVDSPKKRAHAASSGASFVKSEGEQHRMPLQAVRAKNFPTHSEFGIMLEISKRNWESLRAKRRAKSHMTKRKTTATGLSKKSGHNGSPSAVLPVGRMRPFEGWAPPSFLSPVLLAGLVFLCGCQTAQNLFSASGSGWRVQQGQALWRPRHGLPEFGGDLVLARDDAGRCLIQFDKTPMAILSAQTTSNRWLIKFPQRQMSFSGNKPPPLRFSWLYLPTALAGGPLPKQLRFERKPDGGWRLENSRTGETVEGFLPT